MNDPTTPKPRAWRIQDYDQALRTLEQLRVEQDLSYVELGKRIGMPRQTLSEILRGKRIPGANRIPDIAAGLGFDLALVPREEA